MATVTSTVRGGGSGSSAWVARLVGVGGPYGLQRAFCRAEDRMSGSGRSGSLVWNLEPGVYEYRGVQLPAGEASIGDLRSGYLHVTNDGTAEEISRDAAAALIAQS